MKTLLGSQAVQKQASGCIWPSGCDLLALDLHRPETGHIPSKGQMGVCFARFIFQSVHRTSALTLLDEKSLEGKDGVFVP